jgi:hypothetical protein
MVIESGVARTLATLLLAHTVSATSMVRRCVNPLQMRRATS